MSVSAPRLPRLGGHQPAPMRSSSTAPLSTPHSPAPFSCVDPADVARAPDRMNRPYINVGYDEDSVPLASRGSGSLSGGGVSDTGAVPLQQPRPSSRPVAAHSFSSALADSWKVSMRDEVLHGKTLRQSSPEAAAAVPRESPYSTLAEDDDIEVIYADEDSVEACEESESGGGATHPAHRYPVVLPESCVAKIVTPPVPVLNALAAPASPVSASSSIATDTPRSILRQSGTASSKTLRSSSRRISFVGISPPRADEQCPRRHGGEESENDSDEYESAEPSLHYDRETPSMFATATPPRHARKVHTCDAYSPDSHHDSHQSSGGGSNRASSPAPAPQQPRASSSPSPKSPRLSSRSPTHSPPRDSQGRYTSPVGPPLSAAVTAPSAPPPPEEEGDEITLDVAPQHHARAPPHLLRRPEQGSDQRRARSISMGANGRDEDVMTQPHHRSETGGVPVATAVVVRCPPLRNRWPSDAYQDDPPTEANVTQRTRRHRRESLDPEDDMGSSSHTSSRPADSDDSLSSHNNTSPLKTQREERQEASYRHTSLSPPIRPPLHRSSANASEQRVGTSSSSRSRSSSGSRRSQELSSAPPSLTQQDKDESSCGGTSHEQHHGRYSRGVEMRRGQLAETSAPGATPRHHSRGMQVGGERRGQDSHAADGAPPPRREASYGPSAGYSPSTITDHSSGQSMADDLSVSVNAVAAQEARRAPFPLLNKHLSNTNTRAGAPKNSQQQLRVVPSATSTSTAGAPARLAMKAAAAVIADEPQICVDPLSSERRRHDELVRQRSPPHLEQPSLGAGAMRDSLSAEEPQLHRRHSRLNALRRSPQQRQLTISEPVSLRDVMMRHDSPAAKSQRGTPSSQSAIGPILRLPSGPRQLQPQHGGASDNDAAHARTLGSAAMEASVASSSLLSSGGVPADELVWDAPTPASRTSSSASPPVSPSSSVSPVPDTPGGRKVFRKKLVVVVRRRKRGAAPSEDDPVIQMSLLPFKEGAAALLKSNPSLQGSPQQQRARSEGAPAAGTAPALVKLIDHVERGWSASVSSRCPSRASHRQDDMSSEVAPRRNGSGDHAHDDKIREVSRRRFRRALSVLSSRNASPRTSVSPSSTKTTARPDSSRSRSPRSRNGASYDSLSPECRNGRIGEEAELDAGAAARRRSSGHRHGSQAAAVSEEEAVRVGATSPSSRRSSRGGLRHTDEKSRHKSKDGQHHHRQRRHEREDSTRGYVEHRRRSLSPAAMLGAPYRATQNDEYYGAADMAKDVAALLPPRSQERIGITPMSIQLLPRLVLRSELGMPPQQRDSYHPHSNIDTGQRSSGAWSTSDDEAENSVARITEEPSGGRRSRPLRLQVRDGAQIAQEAGGSLARGGARNGMPLLAATPVQRISSAGPIEGTCDSEHLGHLVDAPMQAAGAGGAPSPLVTAHVTVGKDVFKDERVPTNAERAATLPLVDDASVVESPALFVKRAASPTAAATPSASLISLVRVSDGKSAATGGGEAEVFGRGAEASRTATAALPLSLGSAHMAETRPQRATPHVGTAAYETMDGAAGVPLFVPPLTVDNVSQLSHDWQSTLRERSSQAKRDAMEKFLIASAEAGAAAAVAAGVSPSDMRAGGYGEPLDSSVRAEAPCERQRRASPTQAHQSLRPEKPCGLSAASAPVTILPLAGYAPSPQPGSQSLWGVERGVRQRSGNSSSAAQPAPRQQQAAKEAVLPASLKTGSVQVATKAPADGASRSGKTPVKCDGSVRKSAEATSKHRGRQNRLALPEPRRSKSDGDPLTDAFDVETPSTVAGDSTGKCSIAAKKGSKADEVADEAEIFQEPLSAVSLSAPPTPAEEKQRARRDDETDRSSSRRRSRSSRGKAAVTKEAAQTGANGASVSSARRSPPVFSIVEPVTEAHEPGSAKKTAKRRDGNPHRRDERGKHSSRHGTNASRRRSLSLSSAEASQSKSSGRKKSKKGKSVREDYDNKRKKRKHGHERHGRHSRGRARSRSTRSGDATVFDMDEESDVDSDLTTSMEFQLSRLLLLREAAALTMQTPSAVAGVSRRSKHKEDKANRMAAGKAAAAKKDKRHRHRSHSLNAKKAKSRSKRAAKRRSASSAGETLSSPSNAAEKKDKRKRHRTASPPKPEPLPPPPPPQRSRVLLGDEAAANSTIADGAADPTFASLAPRSNSGDRYHRGDHAASASSRVTFEGDIHSRFRYPSARLYFRGGSIYSGGQSEGAEAVPARHRTAARTDLDSEAPYKRYRRRSRDTSPLRSQRPYAASVTSRWADASREAYRPASRYAAALEDPFPRHHSYSSPNRPSTRWNDHAQGAERGATSRTSSSLYTYARHSQSLAQRRGSTGTGTTTAGARASGSGGWAGSHASAQPAPRTYLDTYTSRRRQTDLIDDIDDIPIRQYFSRNGQGDADERGSCAQYGATSAFERRRSRSNTSDPAPPGNCERSRAAAEKNRADEDDFLVSTPLQEGSEECWRRNTEDFVGPRQSPRPRTRATRRPPPPSPPPASTSSSAAETGGLFAAIPRSGALPIVAEHTVTDAHAAEDFVRGVKEVVSALQQYWNPA
ncbi:hypothetical protein JIQ42_01459 [Leishmania sp. Namibia]|uniref:hypothetical protein n=1 Tax=Leishmania sp. Namibia TaxID=2802991 RepID=UPI001B664F9C|nr:hypothetical protein JIQ42_01459 [Leishmania sp. Namibia]